MGIEGKGGDTERNVSDKTEEQEENVKFFQQSTANCQSLNKFRLNIGCALIWMPKLNQIEIRIPEEENRSNQY